MSNQLKLDVKSIIPNSKFIYGKTRDKKRKEYINMFQDRELKCLIGGKMNGNIPKSRSKERFFR